MELPPGGEWLRIPPGAQWRPEGQPRTLGDKEVWSFFNAIGLIWQRWTALRAQLEGSELLLRLPVAVRLLDRELLGEELLLLSVHKYVSFLISCLGGAVRRSGWTLPTCRAKASNKGTALNSPQYLNRYISSIVRVRRTIWTLTSDYDVCFIHNTKTGAPRSAFPEATEGGAEATCPAGKAPCGCRHAGKRACGCRHAGMACVATTAAVARQHAERATTIPRHDVVNVVPSGFRPLGGPLEGVHFMQKTRQRCWSSCRRSSRTLRRRMSGMQP